MSGLDENDGPIMKESIPTLQKNKMAVQNKNDE